MLKRHHLLVLATALAACAAACGGKTVGGGETNTPSTSPTPPDSTGKLDVTYTFAGTEYPNSMELMLIDGAAAGQTCTTLPFHPSSSVIDDQPGLPISGSAEMSGLAPGAKYMVVAFGTKADGTRVAAACHDQVNVVAGQTTQVQLSIANWVADATGVWNVDQHVNIGLPSNVQAILLTLQGFCGVLNQPQLCNIVDQVTQVLTNMDVVAQWTVNRNPDGTYSGTVKWIKVQGQSIGNMDIADGTFSATVPGSTQMQFKASTVQIQFGNLMLFVVQDVLGYDLGQLGAPGAAFVTSLAGQYVSPMDFTGLGTMVDTVPQDGKVDTMNGNLTGTIQVSSWSHDFSMSYAATRP